MQATASDIAERTLRRLRLTPEAELERYTPLPWQEKPLADTSPLMLLTGSAGGGKSHLMCEKVHRFLLNYPGARWAIGRHTRESAMKTVEPLMWNAVVKNNPRVRRIPSRNQYEYSNGSVLHFIGMANDEQRQAVRSLTLDGVAMDEANALQEADHNELSARMRGRAGPYRQIIYATNPDAPNHWINQRLILGREAAVYYSTAKDNPHNPVDYLERLEQLTGTLYERLVLGLWVQAQGAIYDNFLPEHNVSEAAEYNPDWPVYWAVDDGYVYGQGPGSASYHPRVFLLAQITPQGRLHIFHEYYQCGEVEEASIANVRALGYPLPDAAFVDSSAAQLKARLWGEGIQTVGATHKVADGINLLRTMLCDAQEQRLVLIHPRCRALAGELQSYRWQTMSTGDVKPAKVDDHGPDALRYIAHGLRYMIDA